ncbi:carboxypeptidase regulatory-like domain-containing protein [Ramlibacter sp.]|uniref:carboxypeptidase regulatory-like domain-containing protein n=1 Tax=Ramlibacter sp. TaxID=1917967 RepID=UPI00262AF3D0|nr:carboxypeptidase regulatory-like domain-containing protein [Ramlibacter sp.]MDB5954862.1 putative exported protein [Ramlibacter sp.]
MMKQYLILAVLCQAAALACAQSAPAARGDASAAKFVCGGVGQDEQEKFKHDAASHNALVTFATPGGAYVAGVDVKVSDSGGKLLTQGRCEGPLMLLDVPGSGRFRIDAAYGGQQQGKDVQLGGSTPARISFVWNAR